MKNGTAHRGNGKPAAQAAGLSVVPADSDSGTVPTLRTRQPPAAASSLESGIVVREDELVSVKAQRMFKMRCECSRSWFELELPRFVECPACKKLGLVSG